MSIGLTDELEVKTKKGKLAAAKQIFLNGDQENLQQIGDKTHQLENAVKDITATGGASTANAVSYNNENSGMSAITAQGAIDELATKNKSQDTIIAAKAEKSDVQSSISELKAKNTLQDAEIAKKANSADVTSLMKTEQSRVNTELGKKFDKESILQESGDAEDKVMSQKAVSTKLSDLSESIPPLIHYSIINIINSGGAIPMTNLILKANKVYRIYTIAPNKDLVNFNDSGLYFKYIDNTGEQLAVLKNAAEFNIGFEVYVVPNKDSYLEYRIGGVNLNKKLEFKIWTDDKAIYESISEHIVQELGNAENKAMSQKAVSDKFSDTNAKINDLKIKKVLLDELPYITKLAENVGSFSFTNQDIKETKTVFLNIRDLQGTNFVLYNNTIDSLQTVYKITFYDDSLKYISHFKSTENNIECTIPDNACYVSISYSKPEAYIKIDNISKRIIVPNLYNGISYDSSFFGVSYKNHIDFIAVSKGLVNVQNVLYTNSEDSKKQTLSYINGDYENLKSWEQHKGNSQNIHQLSKEEDSGNIFFTFEEPIFGTVKIYRPNSGWIDGYTCIDEYNNSTLNTKRFNSKAFIAAFCKKLKANNVSEVDKYLYYKDEDVCKIPSNDSKANILPKELLGFSNPFSLVDGEINTSTFIYKDPLVSYKSFHVINLPVDGDCDYYIGSTDIGFLGYNQSYSNVFHVVFQNEERKAIGYIQNTSTNNVTFKNGFSGWYIKTPALCKFITFYLYAGNTAYKIDELKAFVCKKKNLNIAINEALSVNNTSCLAAENLTRDSKDVSKKIWVLGDSISATDFGGSLSAKRGYGSSGGWVKYFCEQVMPEYIANNAQGGFTVTESSNVGFEGDIIKSGTSNSYIAEIEKLVKLYTEQKVEAPDYLMLVGCTNDFGKTRNNPDGWSQRSVVLKSDLDNNTLNPNGLDYDAFMESKFFSVNNIQIPINKVPMFKLAGAIRYIVQRVGTLFPNCKFIIVTSLQSPDNWVTQKQCHDEMKWVANRLSIPVIDVSGQANTPMLWDMRKEGANTAATIPRRFINDGFHPYGEKDSAGKSFITAGAMYQGLFIAEQFKTLMLHDTAMRKNVIDYTQGDEGNGYPSGN